ncbi:hypothetical protein LCGC14_1157040 [marine sediment metagenome]|uniref:Uncharacterized protein n=1 Tax=marine sediment metagenome TaxID=412755 RepID=A0A0F9LTR9_9ZZZZ
MKEVLDKKLAELIERYGESVNGLTSSGLRENIFINKQAIIDYHNKKVQDEYILKSLHLKIKNDWFVRGLKAGKISKNTSGCCCVIEDDGETISSLCGAHKYLHDKKMEDATKHIGKCYVKWEEDIQHLNLSVLEKELLGAIKKDLVGE